MPSRVLARLTAQGLFHDLGEDEMHWYGVSQKRQTLNRFLQHRQAAYIVTRRRDSEFFRELEKLTMPWKRIGRFEIRLHKSSPAELPQDQGAP